MQNSCWRVKGKMEVGKYNKTPSTGVGTNRISNIEQGISNYEVSIASPYRRR